MVPIFIGRGAPVLRSLCPKSHFHGAFFLARRCATRCLPTRREISTDGTPSNRVDVDVLDMLGDMLRFGGTTKSCVHVPYRLWHACRVCNISVGIPAN